MNKPAGVSIPWLDYALAALPHLMWMLIGVVGKFYSTPIQPSWATLALGLGIAVILAGILAAWRRGWPLWSASWYAYAAWAVVLGFYWVLRWSGLDQDYRLNNLFVISALISLILFYLLLSRWDQRRALIMLLFLTPVSALNLLEYIPDSVEAWLAVAAGTACVAVTIGIMATHSLKAHLLIYFSANVCIGFLIGYAGTTLAEAPFSGGQRNIMDLLNIFGAYLVACLILAGLPTLIWSGWDYFQTRMEAV